jgi:ribosome-binding factor A
MKTESKRPPSQRQLRVGEEMRHVIAGILTRGELRDPVLLGVNLTLTEVRIGADLKNATAFIVPLGGGDMDRVVEALNRAAGFLRGLVAREMSLRHVPRLIFEADRSFDEAGHVSEILARPSVCRDLQPQDGGPAPAEVPESGNGA